MNAEWVWIESGATVAVFLAAFWKIARQLVVPRAASVPQASQRVAGGYYKPMERLLHVDPEALAAAGFSPGQIAQLRTSRRRAFRGYLGDLRSDFLALHHEAKLAARDSGRPDLVVEVVKVYFSFQLSLIGANLRLAAHACGLPIACSVPLPSAEWMRQQLELLHMPGSFPAGRAC